jgi:hypothetical protein
MTDAGYREILALRERIRRIEQLAKAAAPPPPADNPATFGDALAELRRTGSASGPAIDALRRQITARPEPATAPSRDQLAEATAHLTADLKGSATIEGAYADMRSRAARRNVVEMADAGALGRVDPTDPARATAIDRLRKALSEEH